MKQERIDELLKGTGYDVRHPVFGEDNREQLHKDTSLNAARVQLLAKALRSIAASTCCDTCQEAKQVATAALKEAGMGG